MRKLFSTLVLAFGLTTALATGAAFASQVFEDDFDDVASVPEPTAFLAMGVGLGVIALAHRRRRR